MQGKAEIAMIFFVFFTKTSLRIEFGKDFFLCTNEVYAKSLSFQRTDDNFSCGQISDY